MLVIIMAKRTGFIPDQVSKSKSTQKIRATADIPQPDRKPELGFWFEPVVEDSEVQSEVQALVMISTGKAGIDDFFEQDIIFDLTLKIQSGR